MAAVTASHGRIRFTADGDTFTPIANLEIARVVFSPPALTAGASFTITKTSGGAVLVQGISGSGDSIDIPVNGSVTTSNGITWNCAEANCVGIVYLK